MHLRPMKASCLHTYDCQYDVILLKTASCRIVCRHGGCSSNTVEYFISTMPCSYFRRLINSVHGSLSGKLHHLYTQNKKTLPNSVILYYGTSALPRSQGGHAQ